MAIATMSLRMTPRQILRLSKKDIDKMHMKLKVLHEELLTKKYSRSYAFHVYATIRSFLKRQGLIVPSVPRSLSEGRTSQSEYLMNQIQVSRMVQFARKLRDKALITFLFQSGQWREILHALRVKDVLQCLNTEKLIEKLCDNATQKQSLELYKPQILKQGPYIVQIPSFFPDEWGRNCNKASGVKYKFAFGEEAGTLIKMVIQERLNLGERVNLDSFLFRTYSFREEIRGAFHGGDRKGAKNVYHDYEKYFKDSKGRWISHNAIRLSYDSSHSLNEGSISEIVNDAALAAGIQEFYMTSRGKRRAKIHAHLAREYLKRQLREGGCQEQQLLECLLGHKAPFDGVYDHFTSEMIRKEYGKAEWKLSVFEPKVTIDSKAFKFRPAEMLRQFGLTEEVAVARRVARMASLKPSQI